MELDYWYEKYLNEMAETLCSTGMKNNCALQKLSALIKGVRNSGKKVIIVGNGGSAAIASHVAVDLTKTSLVRAISFNEADLITCFANDYGYEHWAEKAVKAYGDEGDLLIAISSSGESQNIINVALEARSLNLNVVTFSGFKSDNHLRDIGHINFWVDSKQYNFVEMTHQAWLLAIVDRIAEENKK